VAHHSVQENHVYFCWSCEEICKCRIQRDQFPRHLDFGCQCVWRWWRCEKELSFIVVPNNKNRKVVESELEQTSVRMFFGNILWDFGFISRYCTRTLSYCCENNRTTDIKNPQNQKLVLLKNVSGPWWGLYFISCHITILCDQQFVRKSIKFKWTSCKVRLLLDRYECEFMSLDSCQCRL